MASIDCDIETNLQICEYFNVKKAPRFVVLRTTSGNRFYQFPLAYPMSAHNLWRWSLNFWPQSYTWHELHMDGESVYTDDWYGWARSHVADMLEESAQFFKSYGFEFLRYHVLLCITIILLFGPMIMATQTWKLYKWVQARNKT